VAGFSVVAGLVVVAAGGFTPIPIRPFIPLAALIPPADNY
jgi:hypothetical protein